MRPIDADALKEAFEEDGHLSGYIEEFIDDMPTLDVLPGRRGEWVDEIEPNAITASGREVHVFRCSACDFTWTNKYAVLHYFKHCPNCGADMRKEEHHEPED